MSWNESAIRSPARKPPVDDDPEFGHGEKLTFTSFYDDDDDDRKVDDATLHTITPNSSTYLSDDEDIAGNVWASSDVPKPPTLSTTDTYTSSMSSFPPATLAATKFTDVAEFPRRSSSSYTYTPPSPPTPTHIAALDTTPKLKVLDSEGVSLELEKVNKGNVLSESNVVCAEDISPVPVSTAGHRRSDTKGSTISEMGELERHFFPDPASPEQLVSSPVQASEWSHQQMVSPILKRQGGQHSESHESNSTKESVNADANGENASEKKVVDECAENRTNEDGWQEMPVFASHDIYDDDGNIIAHEEVPSEDEEEENKRRGGAGKGYTRVTLDEDDAENAGYIDESTKYLFHDDDPTDIQARNPLNQMHVTKELLTDTQRIAYVGLCKLVMVDMATDLARKKGSEKIARYMSIAYGSMAMWSQKMIMRLYAHMDITPEEQLMIEQLASHGVETMDLTRTLMLNARVRNPMAHDDFNSSHTSHVLPASSSNASSQCPSPLPEYCPDAQPIEAVQNPAAIEDQKTLDIDVRWTVLCDLFLVLVADSVYDARSRTLLERVGAALNVMWLDIAKFEKRVTDALDIEEGSYQIWKEDDIIEARRKRVLKKKYVYMGLATLGGGLVIGLSAGILAPVIGAGLAAGFTTIGIAGTSGFLAGAGGTAIVTTTGAVIGAKIGSQGMARRMGHVRTFEFRPLHNNERVNLIVTVSGWLSGKEDDVRLPFSTVDPIMGDIFSLYWEPDMLTSMGQTINLLATEVITQSIQQVLGSTVLVALMASLQLPMMLAKLSYLLDNPWSVSLDRAWAAGLILADTLIQRNLGVRPVTLVGFSLGARVIASCLIELAKRNAFGLVQNVYIFGSPVVVKRDQIVKASSIVSGRFLNGYSRRDWILGYLFRATSGGLGRIAGLAPIEGIDGIENYDCTEFVDGHMGYREAMPRLLSACGWEVLSEEFTEIEDPDPDQQRELQRELIAEFEEAKRRMERENGRVKKQGLFSKWIKPKRKEWWEMVEEDAHAEQAREGSSSRYDNGGPSSRDHSDSRVSDDGYTPPPSIQENKSSYYRAGQTQYEYQFKTGADGSEALFDVDAIRREIEKAKRERRHN
ncbi:uncharacterized protein V1513DRAFT_446254 [Lipomyces chichibuensis]|uniref:uncharacterized protein n=1 Tax=Lipomyces chichibuensis TaxID=1546026 RepID=UPI003343F2CF